MSAGWGASRREACPGRLVVVGGSSSSGYGLDGATSYAQAIADEYGFELVELVEHAILTHRAHRLVRRAALQPGDALILHVGMWDMRKHLPRSWMRVVHLARSGRGRLEGFPADMRLWSRIRRTIAVGVDGVLTRLANGMGRQAPTPLAQILADGTAIEESLAGFEGPVVLVLPERAPYMPPASNVVTRTYADTFRWAIEEPRRAAGLPVVSIDLTEELHSGDYQDDGFHPNALGHKKIAQALDAALSTVPDPVRIAR